VVVVVALSALAGARLADTALVVGAGWALRELAGTVLNRPLAGVKLRLWQAASGRDVLLDPKDRVVLPAGCERIEPWFYGDTTLRVPPRIKGRRVTVAMPNPCLYAYENARCRVKATLFLDGHQVGTEQVRWRRERDGGRALRFVLPRRPRAGDVLWLRLVKHETGEPDERGGYSVRLR